MNSSVPTRDEFFIGADSDQMQNARHAWESFGGQSLEKAYERFRKDPIFYQEDLMWMAPKPFCFYLPVALRYLQSEESAGNCDIINCMPPVIDFHFESEHDIKAAYPCIQAICDYILSNYAKFEVSEDLYGDLRPLYAELRQKLG